MMANVSVRQWARATGYTLIVFSGVAAAIWPAPSVRAAAGPMSSLVYVWVVLLIVGGGCSAIGAATGRWLGEYVGLWPLIFTFAVYGIAAGATGRTTSLTAAFALGSIGVLLYARWRDVALVRQEAVRYGTRRTESG